MLEVDFDHLVDEFVKLKKKGIVTINFIPLLDQQPCPSLTIELSIPPET